MRDAPSLALAMALEDAGAKLRVYDPVAMAQAKPSLPRAVFCSDAYDCAEEAEALVIVTEWDMFRALDFGRLSQVMRAKVLVDLRNVYSGEDVRRRGFAYVGVGVP
jgi:UDPglucose 6-dehydrogenase